MKGMHGMQVTLLPNTNMASIVFFLFRNRCEQLCTLAERSLGDNVLPPLRHRDLSVIAQPDLQLIYNRLWCALARSAEAELEVLEEQMREMWRLQQEVQAR